MQGYRLCCEIVSHTSHLHCIRSKVFPSFAEFRSLEGDWKVSFGHNKHSDDFFVSIDNEVASKLSHVFSASREFFFIESFEVAELASNHRWDISEFDFKAVDHFIVELPSNCRKEWDGVCHFSLSAL